MGWKISDKPTVDPKDTDLVLTEQDGNTRNTTWAKLKAFFLGTATLTTTDQTIKGSINEVKASTDANTTSLSTKVNKTSIANNLTTTVAGSVLDATQGKILQDSINTKANISYESPIVPTMLNSWVNYGGAYSEVGYWKDSLGNVHLKGLIKSGVMSNAAFILPVGYRPLLTLNIPSQSANSFALIAIASDGTVTPAVGTNTSISLDGITFKAGV